MSPFLLLLSLPLLQEPAPQPVQTAVEAVDALRSAVADLGKAGSYQFSVLTTSSGGGFSGRGGTEGAEPPAPQPWKGIWQKGQPVVLKQGEVEAARLDNVVIYRSGGKDAEWQRMEMRRGGFGRGQGRGQGGQGGQGRGDGAERPPRGQGTPGGFRGGDTGMGQAFAARGVALPHEQLANLHEQIEEGSLVRLTRKDGSVVFEGKFTQEAALAMARGGRGRGFGGRGASEGPQIDASGGFRLVVDAKGRLQDFRVKAKMSGSFRDREFERENLTEGSIKKHGECKVELGPKPRELLKPAEQQEEEF